MTVASDPIGEHLATLPQPQRDTLAALAATLRALLPGAEECISYKMPCFKVDGRAVAGFDGFAKHCSYFPHSGGVLAQIEDVPAWCTVSSPGTLQFPSIGRCRRCSCARWSRCGAPRSRRRARPAVAADGRIDGRRRTNRRVDVEMGG